MLYAFFILYSFILVSIFIANQSSLLSSIFTKIIASLFFFAFFPYFFDSFSETGSFSIYLAFLIATIIAVLVNLIFFQKAELKYKISAPFIISFAAYVLTFFFPNVDTMFSFPIFLILLCSIYNRYFKPKNGPIFCPKCGTENENTATFCKKCNFSFQNIKPENVVTPSTSPDDTTFGDPFVKNDFVLYDYDLYKMTRNVVEEEVKKVTNGEKFTIPSVEKRKTIFFAVYFLILFLQVLLYVFHKNTFFLSFLFFIITIIFIFILRRYDLTAYIVKEIKSRPDEKISYVVSSILSRKTDNTSWLVARILISLLPLFASLAFFSTPRLFYEKTNDGYVLRYYTIGLIKNDTQLTIPETYNDKPVIGIRGNVFENVSTLKKIILPETIKEIRASAFKNCINLEEINLPKGITEIKANTFEGCRSLVTIVIPEGVVRIGASAFRDCIHLNKVNIPRTVTSIGSSAFRNTALNSVCISRGIYVNERAFKNTSLSIYYYDDGCGQHE